MRALITFEAARIIHDLGRRDYNTARIKAAQRLGCKDQKRLPSNTEIQQALIEYQKIFLANDQPRIIDDLRKLAHEAMTHLSQFSPRLVGGLLGGDADSTSPIQLHLFSESPELIAMHLLDSGIPYQESDKTLFFTKSRKQKQPVFRFYSGETEVELIWFPSGSIGHPPLSAIDQKPEKRVSLTQLKSMIKQE